MDLAPSETAGDGERAGTRGEAALTRRALILAGGSAALLAAGAGWAVWQRPARFDFTPHPVAGFRQIAAGPASLSRDPLVGLAGIPDPVLEDEIARLRPDPREALFYAEGPGVQVASFSDYNCPYCRVLTEKLAAMEAGSGGAMTVSWHELPLLGETSRTSARAALAARRQGAYAAFHKRLMQTRFEPNEAYLAALAESVGIDAARLIEDMASPSIGRELIRSEALGAIFAFPGTPALVVGRTVVVGAIAERRLRQLVAVEGKELAGG